MVTIVDLSFTLIGFGVLIGGDSVVSGHYVKGSLELSGVPS